MEVCTGLWVLSLRCEQLNPQLPVTQRRSRTKMAISASYGYCGSCWGLLKGRQHLSPSPKESCGPSCFTPREKQILGADITRANALYKIRQESPSFLSVCKFKWSSTYLTSRHFYSKICKDSSFGGKIFSLCLPVLGKIAFILYIHVSLQLPLLALAGFFDILSAIPRIAGSLSFYNWQPIMLSMHSLFFSSLLNRKGSNHLSCPWAINYDWSFFCNGTKCHIHDLKACNFAQANKQFWS